MAYHRMGDDRIVFFVALKGERIARMLELPVGLASAPGRGSTFSITVPRVTAVVDGRELVTVDPVIRGRHFDDSIPPESVGAKLLRRNLSDIAAMGGRPRAAPRDSSDRTAEVIYGGDLRGNLKSLRGLRSLRLTSLECVHQQISDLSFLARMPLNRFEAGWNDIADLSPLASLPVTELMIVMEFLVPLVIHRFGPAAIIFNGANRRNFAPESIH